MHAKMYIVPTRAVLPVELKSTEAVAKVAMVVSKLVEKYYVFS